MMQLCLRAAFLAVLSAQLVSAAPADAQVANLGFETTKRINGRRTPAGWMTQGVGYEIVLDTSTRVEGRASLRSRRIDSASFAANGSFGLALQRYSMFPARGRALRLTGWIRTEEVTEGYAGLWIRVDGEAARMLFLENMHAQGPRGTTSWTRYSIEVPVDSSVTGIVFGVLHPGSGTAWFDSLSLEVVGPARPRVPRAGTVEPPPRPAEDYTKLLTDAELAVPADTAAPKENDAWSAWVRAHAHPIRSLRARDFSDLGFLASLLNGKRIVQLGESGHGVREFNLAKVRLIQYLHEELGYDVLAFESSLFECDRAGRDAPLFAAVDLMRRCIFGVWHTEELVPLFDYVKQTQTTARPLVLTGFDVQASTMQAASRPVFLRRVVAAIDSAYARRAYSIDSAFVAASFVGNQGNVPEASDRFVAFYDSLATWLRTHERALVSRFATDSTAPIVARQTAVSMSVFVRVRAASGREGFELRDRGMADNLDFILDELHPGKKVIVWAHNSHVQHRGYGAARRPPSDSSPRSMGTYVAERHRAQLYTVGLYMYRGNAALNTRTVYTVTPATTGSLESILHRAPWRYSFVDLSKPKRTRGTEWIFQRISAKEWGVTPQLIVPRDEYDGILFIDRVWPPQYVR